MNIEPQAKLLIIYTGELDKYKYMPLYEAIVYAAKKSKLAGATVTKGIMAYGANSKIRTSKVFALSNDLPIRIELVDNENKINNFIKVVKKMFDKSNSAGLIITEDVNVELYQANKKKLI